MVQKIWNVSHFLSLQEGEYCLCGGLCTFLLSVLDQVWNKAARKSHCSKSWISPLVFSPNTRLLCSPSPCFPMWLLAQWVSSSPFSLSLLSLPSLPSVLAFSWLARKEPQVCSMFFFFFCRLSELQPPLLSLRTADGQWRWMEDTAGTGAGKRGLSLLACSVHVSHRTARDVRARE